MENNSKKIKALETEATNLRGMWVNALCEMKALRYELELYKKLCKAQAEIVHRELEHETKEQ